MAFDYYCRLLTVTTCNYTQGKFLELMIFFFEWSYLVFQQSHQSATNNHVMLYYNTFFHSTTGIGNMCTCFYIGLIILAAVLVHSFILFKNNFTVVQNNDNPHDLKNTLHQYIYENICRMSCMILISILHGTYNLYLEFFTPLFFIFYSYKFSVNTWLHQKCLFSESHFFISAGNLSWCTCAHLTQVLYQLT